MKRIHPKPIAYGLRNLFCWVSLVVAFHPEQLYGQCDYLTVEHFFGTETVGCTEVTITSDGSVGLLPTCGYGPYWVGAAATGSYTFSFSPAISGVQVSLGGLNGNNGLLEELSFEINGAFYPITNPGVADGCFDAAEITGAGTIRAVPGTIASWQDVTITENITSIKIENIYLAGVCFGTSIQLKICCEACLTDAGDINSSPLNICLPAPAEFPDATQTALDADDLLQYILFENQSQPLNSIIATSNVPQFVFNPATMQPNQTYFVASIAGNNVNGSVNTNDPCFDISEAVSVVWRPLPTVSFGIDNAVVCAGECASVTAIFTGTAPFSLLYEAPGVGQNTLVFQNFTNTFQLCLPPDAPPGNLTLQALSISDENCICE